MPSDYRRRPCGSRRTDTSYPPRSLARPKRISKLWLLPVGPRPLQRQWTWQSVGPDEARVEHSWREIPLPTSRGWIQKVSPRRVDWKRPLLDLLTRWTLTARPPAPSGGWPTPRRGEIWTADLGEPPRRHWVLIVSLDARNQSDRVATVLIVPFSSAGPEGPTVLALEPGETGLPGTSYLKGHFLTTLPKARLGERQPRTLSGQRMRQVCELVRRSFDPDAPYEPHRRKQE